MFLCNTFKLKNFKDFASKNVFGPFKKLKIKITFCILN